MARRLWRGLAFGALLAVPLALLLRVAAMASGVADPAEALFERVTSLLPGALVTAGIDALVAAVRWLDAGQTARVAKGVEHLAALVSFVVVTGALGALVAAASATRRFGLTASIALLGSLLVAALASSPFDARPAGAIAASVLVVVLGYQAWGALLVVLLWPSKSEGLAEAGALVTRRRALLVSAAAALASTGGLALLPRRRSPPGPPLGTTLDEETRPLLAVSSFEAAPGTRPELTSVEDFYRVDINLTPPVVDASAWRLELGGLVARPEALSLDDLDRRALAHQTITLECISNPVGGDLISTAHMTGVRLADLLEEARLSPRARAVRFTCADGYHESLPLESALDERTLLVVGMNGERLNAEHGFPLRLYTPGRFGMKNPKWIVRVDVVEEQGKGYWAERGWSHEAPVRITSVIDTTGRLPLVDGRAALGGIAFAGARGVSRVEVRVDDGPFEEAETKPPLSPLTWVLWRRDVPLARGKHRVTVRAWDGAGAMQTAEERRPHPSGASGWHEVEVEL